MPTPRDERPRPTGAGKRRLEKPVAARPAAPRRASLRRLATAVRISPAMIGVVAMSAAGLGTYASAGTNAADRELAAFTYDLGAVPPSAADTPPSAAVDHVDVSRSIDRPTLERQTAQQAAQREEALRQIDRDITATTEVREREEKVRAAEEERRLTQWVLPVTGYTLTARFGQQSSLWSSGAHTGLDFAGPSGTEIVSVAAGTVTSAGYDGSYGNRTVVTLPDGTMISYCHQSRISVGVGDQVTPGQPIGFTGATGNVTGPHLHLEVELPGSGTVDPEPVLRAHGIDP